MADEVTTAQVDDLSGIAIQEATLTAQNLSQLKDFITVKTVPTGSSAARFPRWGGLTAAGLTEGNDVANSAASTTGPELTPTTNAVWATVVTDIAVHDAPQVFADLGKAAASAIVQKINDDIFALFDGFATVLGSGTVDITEEVIRQGRKKLLQQSVQPNAEMFLVITPEVFEDLMGLYSLNTNNTSDVIREAIYRGEAPPIYGVRIVLHTSGLSEAGDIKCGLFARDALGMAVSWDMKLEVTRRPRAIGWDFVMSSSYAVGELIDLHGIEMLLDGAD